MKRIVVVNNKKKNNSLIFFYKKIIFVFGHRYPPPPSPPPPPHSILCDPPHAIMTGAPLLCGVHLKLGIIINLFVAIQPASGSFSIGEINIATGRRMTKPICTF